MKDVSLNGFVRIQLQDGKVDHYPLGSLSTNEKNALEGFLIALCKLHEVLPLPNLNFILSLTPHSNRPVLRKALTVPLMAFSKEEHHPKIVLIPKLTDPDREEKLLSIAKLSWEDKNPLAIWRGSPSDGTYGHYDWDFRFRTRLALLSKRYPDLLDASFVFGPSSDNQARGRIKSYKLDGEYLTPHVQAENKYLISLDGRGASSSLEWQLFSKSLIFKAKSNQVQWFSRGLNADEHFIAFHPDSSDLMEKIDWAINQEETALKTSKNGYDFALETLLDEELFLYLYRVFDQYTSFFKEE